MGKKAQNHKAKKAKGKEKQKQETRTCRGEELMVGEVWLDYAAEVLTEISMGLMGSSDYTWSFEGYRGTTGSCDITYTAGSRPNFSFHVDVVEDLNAEVSREALEVLSSAVTEALFSREKINFVDAVEYLGWALMKFFQPLNDAPPFETNSGVIRPVRWRPLLTHINNERFGYTGDVVGMERVIRGFTLPCGGRVEVCVSEPMIRIHTSCALPQLLTGAVESWARMTMLAHHMEQSGDEYVDSSIEMRCLLATNFARLLLHQALEAHTPESCGTHEPVHPGLVFASK